MTCDRLRFLVAAAMLAAAPAQAATLDATAAVSFVSTFRVNDATALPAGIVAAPSGPSGGVATTTRLDAPAAFDTTSQNVVIAGTSEADPSEFDQSSRSERPDAPDIAQARSEDDIWGVLVLSPEPPNDFVEHGYRGYGVSDVILFSPDSAGAGALVDAERSRTVTFRNLTTEDYFFALRGRLETTARAEFIGADGFSDALARVSLSFESTDPLAISFAATSPYLPNEVVQGATGTTAIERMVDVAGTGVLSLMAAASVQGLDPSGDEYALATGGFDYLLGVTLRPGEVLTMTHALAFRAEIDAVQRVAPVPAPASAALLPFAMGALALLRRRRGKGRGRRS